MARDEVSALPEGRYRLIGSTASPYSIKLRALLRYRRILFDWIIMTEALREATEHLRSNLIPVLQCHDGTYRARPRCWPFGLALMLAQIQEEPTVLERTAGLRGDKDRRPVSYRQSGSVLSNETARLQDTEMGIGRNAAGNSEAALT